MRSSNWNWSEFQKNMTTKPINPILTRVLELFGDYKGTAIDLGCGSGIDTIHLVNLGWRVCSIDGTIDGFENIKGQLQEDKLSSVDFIHADFENVVMPEVDLVYSAYSIPFCKQKAFEAFWSNVVASVNTGGRFAGHLFGEQDGWANFIDDITLKTKAEAFDLFKNFEIEYFDELCEDKPSKNGLGTKRWHVFEIIAMKK